MISKSAIIGKKAQIGKNVQIGNFATIDDDVVIGANTRIGNYVHIQNGARIGENCQIHASAVLAGEPQDLKYKGEYTTLEIGNNNIIREFVTINRGTASRGKTVIGHNNLIMANSHIGHDCVIGDHCVIGFNVGMAGEVTVSDWANVSGLTGIHQFSRIGTHAMVGGLSKIVKDVPPYVIAARDPLTYEGINSIGLSRRGFESFKINELKEIYRIIFQERRNLTHALDLIETNFKVTPERDEIIRFIRNSNRGIIKGCKE
ncbi:acyl-[acyl-carrier-protein]--UDP-N-acetylglucosamine O-acyltransferase [Aquipluma nitroreducens]|uniref:Acyl-[acyl-carrier-protein]--UDP-N-acetylglucosamine O-acyltransferase n=1 Tax=Aquipluma nitroreducens TaxID=2010828 RepID=A0A5K7SDW7_9BACT|nr:acyl-ACP--UDP-N-acetylglucosamine O-acyltransferase [Aquipluma nitroreducens]BBE19763.1 acyl-[acyl-carrier-protein]--UDP-N-acetylglucosamine O-acyltransferase [Aquipluma nitroreducens]